jgi:hypothetical protein
MLLWVSSRENLKMGGRREQSGFAREMSAIGIIVI